MSTNQNISHDLIDFVRSTTEEMSREYDRIQKRATEDPGTAGDQGEENWAALLRGWLSPQYQIVTKGRIINENGIASPQVDVLILHPAYPQYLLNKKLYLADAVLAAFECKLSLNGEHSHKAVHNAAEIRRLLGERSGNPYLELNSQIVYGLLAHSHTWKGKSSTPIENVEKHLWTADLEITKHPREMLDFICVADLATWVSEKLRWLGPEMWDNWSEVQEYLGPEGSAHSGYSCYANNLPDVPLYYSAIGTFITRLMIKLAYHDVSIRDLAFYFLQVFMSLDQPRGGLGRRWPLEIYSEEIRHILKSKISHKNFSHEYWSEWAVHFP